MQAENKVSVYPIQFLFPTVVARWPAKLLIVPEITLSYQYFYNHCLQLMLKWWQKNNGESFQRGAWDAHAYNSLFLKSRVHTAEPTYYCQKIAPIF